ncbi:MAG: tRNA-dihydrouridine synthase [Saccharofermentanales bacterium]
MQTEDKALPPGVTTPAEGFLSLFEPLPVGLAPMAGFTTAPFRTIAADLGASFTVTELVSVRGIRHDPGLLRSGRYLQATGGGKPWGIQLFGRDPDDYIFAIDRLMQEPDYRTAAFIDINMGCPAPKVLREGGGCALMGDGDLVSRIVRASVKAARPCGLPVTVKIRSGLSPERINALEIARRAEEEGAAAVAVHARTLNQYYAGQANWQVIRQVKENLSIPVLGNGDLAQPGDLEKMRAMTACDGFLVGRAARGNPFIFRQLRGGPPAGPEEWLAVMNRHLEASMAHLGEPVAVREMRSHFAFYLRGYPGSSEDRRKVMEALTASQVREILQAAARRRSEAALLY